MTMTGIGKARDEWSILRFVRVRLLSASFLLYPPLDTMFAKVSDKFHHRKTQSKGSPSPAQSPAPVSQPPTPGAMDGIETRVATTVSVTRAKPLVTHTTRLSPISLQQAHRHLPPCLPCPLKRARCLPHWVSETPLAI